MNCYRCARLHLRHGRAAGRGQRRRAGSAADVAPLLFLSAFGLRCSYHCMSVVLLLLVSLYLHLSILLQKILLQLSNASLLKIIAARRAWKFWSGSGRKEEAQYIHIYRERERDRERKREKQKLMYMCIYYIYIYICQC